MSALKNTLAHIFPASCFLSGLKVSKGQRVFSIRLGKLDDAVGLELDAIDRWPAETKRCDGLFLCAPAGTSQLVVVLVELKGGHVQHAIEQIKATSNLFCNKKDVFGIHADSKLLHQMRQLGRAEHGARVLGYIVGKKKLALRQQETASLLKKHRIKIHFTGHASAISCQEILSASDQR